MRLRILSLLSLSFAVSCAQLDESQTSRSGLTDDISVVADQDGNLGFDVKLPDNHGTLAGKSFNMSAISAEEVSSQIKLECLGGILKETGTKIRVNLYDANTKVTHQANFAYNCIKGARAKLLGLEKGHIYQLSIAIFNEKGLIFTGKSGSFSSSSANIMIRMERIKEDSPVNVEIIFPSDPVIDPPAPEAESSIICDFTPGNYPPTKSSGVGTGNLENDIAKPAPGGTCHIFNTSNLEPAETVVASHRACSSNGPSCAIKLGVLKEKKSYRLTISSPACLASTTSREVIVQPGQNVLIRACSAIVQPPLPPVNPPKPPVVEPPLPPVNPPKPSVLPPKPRPTCSIKLINSFDGQNVKVGQEVALAFTAIDAKSVEIQGKDFDIDPSQPYSLEIETFVKPYYSEVKATVYGDGGSSFCVFILPPGKI